MTILPVHRLKLEIASWANAWGGGGGGGGGGGTWRAWVTLSEEGTWEGCPSMK